MGKGTFLLKYYFTNPKQIEPNCNQPVASPQLNHPVHMTCICWKLTLQIPPTRELPTEGFFTRTTSKKKTPELRYRNFEHLLVIQMKIKNLQIFLGQKGATT